MNTNEELQNRDVSIAPLIHCIRGVRVILDTDLARLYEVPTKRLNEQLRRNLDRFPQDFAFQLTPKEWTVLRSQIAISRPPGTAKVTAKQGNALNWSQSATSSDLRRGAAYRPWAFTEHGTLQAANILNSPRAVAMSLYVIRAFVKLREDLAANAAILKRLAEIDKTLLAHDVALRDIYQKLRPLLLPPPEPPKPEIGFHVKENAVRYRIKRKSARSS
jgi:hypothetical protein